MDVSDYPNDNIKVKLESYVKQQNRLTNEKKCACPIYRYKKNYYKKHVCDSLNEIKKQKFF